MISSCFLISSSHHSSQRRAPGCTRARLRCPLPPRHMHLFRLLRQLRCLVVVVLTSTLLRCLLDLFREQLVCRRSSCVIQLLDPDFFSSDKLLLLRLLLLLLLLRWCICAVNAAMFCCCCGLCGHSQPALRCHASGERAMTLLCGHWSQRM